MRLDVREQVDGVAWEAEIAPLGATIYHAGVWAAFQAAAQTGAAPRFATLRDDAGEAVAAALVFEVRSGRLGLGRWTGRAWIDAMPALRAGAESETVAEFLRQLEAWARQRGIVELAVGSYASPGTGAELEAQGFEVVRRMEFELDLTLSEEELWERLEYKRRKNLKKAARLGVVVRELEGEEGMRTLRRLQGESSRRIVERGGPDITFKEEPRGDPVAVLLDAGVARLVGAAVGGEIVSAGLFTCYAGRAYHMLSGHGPTALETQAPTFLLWETIKSYRQQGVRTLNMGGCSAGAVEEGSPEHGVYEYKKAFGGTQLDCVSGRKVLRPGAYRMVRAVRKLLGRS